MLCWNKWRAYLCRYRVLASPEVIAVDSGEAEVTSQVVDVSMAATEVGGTLQGPKDGGSDEGIQVPHEVVGGLLRTLGEIGIANGVIVHMVSDLYNCHRNCGRVNVDNSRQGYRDAQERLMRVTGL
ncbi:hypothetical protein RchiOBHm_Chr1g0348161 [Rosa chinensis]|uniref:Uncharacterized protein n=1 Tax=Rosa chinensis TaxID=74649 RepID=A0A2P6SFG9_ROSCH|nr:hypothetical protein RchiOBHm_Chr1g0348161 [Rosa chinensis]